MNIVNLPNLRVKFYPKDLNAVNETVIYAQVLMKSNRFKFYTNVTLSPKAYKALLKKHKGKITLESFYGGTDVYSRLLPISIVIQDSFKLYVSKCQVKGKDFIFSEFKSDCLSKLKGISNTENKDDKETNLLAFAIHQNNISKSTKSLGTIKTYGTVIKQLRLFKDDKKHTLDFDDINLDFYNEFVDYLYSINPDYAINSIGKKFQIIKTFMGLAQRKGYHSNVMYLDPEFKVDREDVDYVALENHQIEAIENLKLAENSMLMQIRDLFLFNTLCGLRYSDLKLIKKNSIGTTDKGLRYIRYKANKTGKDVNIPLDDKPYKLWERYAFEFPDIYDQKFNLKIKELGRLAGLDEVTDIIRRRKSKEQIVISKPLYKWISTHTMRRTWATNLHKKGVPIVPISKFLGHSKLETTMRYLRMSDDSLVNDYFKGYS
jgi:integrase